MLPEIKYTKINITFLETFGSVFGTEGDTVTLAATMTATPNLANLQPEAQWFRDGITFSLTIITLSITDDLLGQFCNFSY
jgi:hypothetical protein